MKIQWNKVTWYSKLIAVVLFIAVFFLGFYLGREYEEARSGEGQGHGFYEMPFSR